MANSSGAESVDPFDGRQPTSHERTHGHSWDASYQSGPAPWDLGHPQPAIARLASSTVMLGPVLDAGCGTGEHALLLAGMGLPVLGVDVAETAITLARQKATDRNLNAEFVAADALRLGDLGRTFQTVLDCGLFHTFENDERAPYVASLASVAEPGAILYILSFSDQEPDVGPHPVSRQELIDAFPSGSGWQILSIQPERIETRFHEHGVSAWLTTVRRV